MTARPGASNRGERSLRAATVARFVADSVGIACSLLAGVLTARALGPGNKGNLSSLLFVAIMFTHVGVAGLGDGGILLVRRGRATFSHAVRATLPAAVLTAGLASALAVGAAWLEFWGQSQLHKSMLAGGVLVFVGALVAVATSLLNADGRIVLTSVVLAVNLAVAALFTWYFVRVLDLAVLGGMAAAILGNAVALGVFVIVLARPWGAHGPELDRSYVRDAFRIGGPIQLAVVLIALSQRVDQLLVLSFGTQNEAGIYAVSLTLGALVSFPAVALSIATFPRIAALSSEEAGLLVGRVLRMTCLTGVVAAVVIGLCTPIGIPRLFGDDYRPAIGPSIVLLAAGVPAAFQWVLARALSARGRTSALYLSYIAALVVLVALDVVVVPGHGALGAAVVALLSSVLGFFVCLVLARREWNLRLVRLVPRFADLSDLATLLPRGRRLP